MNKGNKYNAPWSFDLSDRLSDGSDCLAISDADGSSVAEMMCPQDVEEHYARLIAAAPALYEALKSLMRAYGASDGRNGNSGECWDMARAAITSAEGKPQKSGDAK